VPDRAAIISPDGSSVAFAQFDAQVGSVAGWVSERTRRGDRIAVIADNSAAYARLSAIPADLLRRALSRLDAGFHQGYGMTETGGNITFLGPAEHRAGADGDAAILASAGRPHDEVWIRIASEKNGVGEILVRGGQVAAGYWPGNTPVSVEGWLHTGGENVSSRSGGRPVESRGRRSGRGRRRARRILPLTSNDEIAKEAVRQYARMQLAR
jgi:acyl-CoA synthetase (AMP-forming)/AMP-acid ligase II